MSYVNLMSRARWTETDHVAQVEASVRSEVTHTREHVVIRRMFQMLLPLLAGMLPPAPATGADPYAATRAALGGLVARCSPVTPAQFAEILAAAAVFAEADVLAEQARADGALLSAALDYEEARDARDALPPLPAPDPLTGVTPDDTLPHDDRVKVEAQRAAFQAQMDAAAPATLALVQQRDAIYRPLPPKKEVTA